MDWLEKVKSYVLLSWFAFITIGCGDINPLVDSTKSDSTIRMVAEDNDSNTDPNLVGCRNGANTSSECDRIRNTWCQGRTGDGTVVECNECIQKPRAHWWKAGLVSRCGCEEETTFVFNGTTGVQYLWRIDGNAFECIHVKDACLMEQADFDRIQVRTAWRGIIPYVKWGWTEVCTYVRGGTTDPVFVTPPEAVVEPIDDDAVGGDDEVVEFPATGDCGTSYSGTACKKCRAGGGTTTLDHGRYTCSCSGGSGFRSNYGCIKTTCQNEDSNYNMFKCTICRRENATWSSSNNECSCSGEREWDWDYVNYENSTCVERSDTDGELNVDEECGITRSIEGPTRDIHQCLSRCTDTGGEDVQRVVVGESTNHWLCACPAGTIFERYAGCLPYTCRSETTSAYKFNCAVCKRKNAVDWDAEANECDCGANTWDEESMECVDPDDPVVVDDGDGDIGGGAEEVNDDGESCESKWGLPACSGLGQCGVVRTSCFASGVNLTLNWHDFAEGLRCCRYDAWLEGQGVSRKATDEPDWD